MLNEKVTTEILGKKCICKEILGEKSELSCIIVGIDKRGIIHDELTTDNILIQFDYREGEKFNPILSNGEDREWMNNLLLPLALSEGTDVLDNVDLGDFGAVCWVSSEDCELI